MFCITFTYSLTRMVVNSQLESILVKIIIFSIYRQITCYENCHMLCRGYGNITFVVKCTFETDSNSYVFVFEFLKCSLYLLSR